MKQRRILIVESKGFCLAAAERLRAAGVVILADLDRQALLREIVTAEVVWVRLRHRLDREVLAAAVQLEAIATATTGLNHIDLQEAAQRGIKVISLRGEGEFLREVRATAEHTLGMMFALLRHIPRACYSVEAGNWNRDLFWGRELHGKVVAIVGFGRLGRIVGGALVALGMRVLAIDPVRSDPLPAGVEWRSLEQALPEADMVSLHVDLNPQSRGFFGREQFGLLKRGAWLINTARGELVDDEALLASLESGHVAGAALDVLSGERSEGMADHPLVRYAQVNSNLIITPHIGGATIESVEKTEMFIAQKLLRALDSDFEQS